MTNVVRIEIRIMPKLRSGQNLQQKRFERLMFVGNRPQAHFIETLSHRRGVSVLRAMYDFPFHDWSRLRHSNAKCPDAKLLRPDVVAAVLPVAPSTRFPDR